MKVKELRLERFKQFVDPPPFKFTNQNGRPLDLIVLIGENGAGKSSILQALNATLATATGQIRHPRDLNWPGFEYERISNAHQGFAKVSVTAEFDAIERQTVQQYFDESDFSREGVRPGDAADVTLVMTDNPNEHNPIKAIGGRARYFQFRGREYAFNMLKRGVRKPDIFRHVGGVLGYNEQRTAASIAPSDYYDESLRSGELSDIRALIRNWDSLTAQMGQKRLDDLRERYSQLFPGRNFSRVGDAFGAKPPDIFFTDGRHEYELSELSGGERAIFPMLIDFINWGIHNSVILIDEIELHLHPPLQQTLIAVLPKLGENNQFIITTHSDAVFDIVPSSSVFRID